MAELELRAIGRLKQDAEATLEERYLKRIRQIGPSCGITSVQVKEYSESRKQTTKLRMCEEADHLTANLQPNTLLIQLDERGTGTSSKNFAAVLRRDLDDGQNHITFLLGGPDGLDKEIGKKAKRSISLSDMTLPHGLARALLLEQLYRALTIWLDHPYHRD